MRRCSVNVNRKRYHRFFLRKPQSKLVKPVGFPVVFNIPSGYETEVQTRSLFSQYQCRMAAQELLDQMEALRDKQYDIALYIQDQFPKLFKRSFGSVFTAAERLRCPPAAVEFKGRPARQCNREQGQCPFCWARRVQDVFYRFTDALFEGPLPDTRTEQDKLINSHYYLYEAHEVEELPAAPNKNLHPDSVGIAIRENFEKWLVDNKVTKKFLGMTSIITVDYCTTEVCKVRVRRVGIIREPFKSFTEIPEGDKRCVLYKPPITVLALTKALGNVLAYPYRDYSIEEMVPVYERFASMPNAKNRPRLLVNTGVLRRSRTPKLRMNNGNSTTH